MKGFTFRLPNFGELSMSALYEISGSLWAGNIIRSDASQITVKVPKKAKECEIVSVSE